MISTISAATVLELRTNPPVLGEVAAARRHSFYGNNAALIVDREVPSSPHSTDEPSGFHGPDLGRLPTCVYLRVPLHDTAQRAYVEYLGQIARVGGTGIVAPFCEESAATHKVWLLAAARLLLPATWHVAARHDLLGVRVAQIALAFGVNVLSGPISEDRSLPLAGVTRPTETSRTALLALVENAGLSAKWFESPSHLLSTPWIACPAEASV